MSTKTHKELVTGLIDDNISVDAYRDLELALTEARDEYARMETSYDRRLNALEMELHESAYYMRTMAAMLESDEDSTMYSIGQALRLKADDITRFLSVQDIPF